MDALASAILGLATNPIPYSVLDSGSTPTGGTVSASGAPSGEQVVDVEAGAGVTGVDFGNFLPGTVSGTVYLDAKGSGTLDSSDPVLAGWKVTLHSDGGQIADGSVTTDASGHFSFANLPASSYTLSETLPSGYRPAGAAGSYPDEFTVASGFSGTVNLGNRVFAAPTHLAISPDNGSSHTDGLTDTGSVTFSGQVDETGLIVHLFDATAGTALPDATVNGQSFSAALNLSAGVHDIQATAMDAAGDTSVVADFVVTIDLTPPAITAVAAVSPNPRNMAVPTVDVTFSKAVNPNAFNPSAVTLTRGGIHVPLSGLTFALVSGTTYRIGGLGAFEGADGNYALTIGGAVTSDAAGNTGTGTQMVTWTVNTAPPSSTVSPLPKVGTSLVFPVTVTGTVPTLPTGSPPVDIASFNVYVSDQRRGLDALGEEPHAVLQHVKHRHGELHRRQQYGVRLLQRRHRHRRQQPGVQADDRGQHQPTPPHHARDPGRFLEHLQRRRHVHAQPQRHRCQRQRAGLLRGLRGHRRRHAGADRTGHPGRRCERPGPSSATTTFVMPAADYGLPSNDYRFYSVGIDAAGLEEPMHSMYDAMLPDVSYSEPSASNSPSAASQWRMARPSGPISATST